MTATPVSSPVIPLFLYVTTTLSSALEVYKKNSQNLGTLLGLASLAQDCIFESSKWCVFVVPLFSLPYGFHRVNAPRFIHFTAERHLGCYLFLAILSCAAMSIFSLLFIEKQLSYTTE